MSFANGTIGELIKALDISGVEMLAISLPDSRIVDATQCLMKQWDCNRYELVGRQLSQSDKSRISARYVDEGISGISTQAQTKIEVTYRPDQGDAQCVRFRPQHVREGNQEYLLLVNPVPERTSESTTASQDKETQARMELAVKAGGYGSWDYDFRNRTHQISNELYTILGYHPGDPRLDFRKFEDGVHPEDRNRTLGSAIKRDPGAKYWLDRFRYKNALGDYIWLEQIAAVIRDPLTGDHVKVIGLLRNISDRMVEVDRLENSQRNLARSQDIAKIGSWVITVATGSLEWSEQMYKIFDFVDQDAPPSFQPIVKRMPDAHRDRWQEAIELAKLGQLVKPFDVDIHTGRDISMRIQVHLHAELDENGRVGTLHGICQDITEQILLERKFLQAQKMESVGRLTGGIAHDFNNLLMVMVGNLQLIEGQVEDDEKILKRVHAVIDAANKGSELTKRMLAFSRQQTLEDENIDVTGLVMSMKEMLTRAIGGNVDLEMIPGERVWPVNADRTQLETAILNLAINARDAMSEGGKLKVEVSNSVLDDAYCRQYEDLEPGAYVMIAVSDTGHGMPAEIIDKVVQPFFTTKPPEAGSGLGLSMIYGFVNQSGGHMDITSEVDKGTTIKIYLPKSAVELEPAVEEEDTDTATDAKAEEPAPADDADDKAEEDTKPAASGHKSIAETLAEIDKKLGTGKDPSPAAAGSTTGNAKTVFGQRAGEPEAEPAFKAEKDETQSGEAAKSSDDAVKPAKTEPPAKAAPPAQASADQESADDEDRKEKHMVLVVEDNDAVRDVAVAMVEDMGYNVLEASNGADALELIRNHPEIDLLLSDVVMAGMNGPELAAEAMKIREDLKVLFASGYTQGAAAEMQNLPNFIELINKPFTRNELTDKVREALRQIKEQAA